MQYNASPEILDDSGWSAIQYGQNYTEVVKIIENYSLAEKGICVSYMQFNQIFSFIYIYNNHYLIFIYLFIYLNHYI